MANSEKACIEYDVAVIGSGPAGMTAALYAARAGVTVALFERIIPGGKLSQSEHIENYPGFPEGVSGYDLALAMKEQVTRFGAVDIGEEVLSVDFSSSPKKLMTGFDCYTAKSVIIATGSNSKKLGLGLEEELQGRGISYCATCDGNFFKGKDVVVVGGGNTAAGDAIYLAKVCKRVYMILRRDKLTATKVYKQILSELDNVEIIKNSSVKELLAKDGALGGIIVEDSETGATREIICEGLFEAVGNEPSTAFLEGAVELDESGYIIADESGKTSVPGVFVAGDVRAKALRQVTTAVADGANTAEEAVAYIAS